MRAFLAKRILIENGGTPAAPSLLAHVSVSLHWRRGAYEGVNQTGTGAKLRAKDRTNWCDAHRLQRTCAL